MKLQTALMAPLILLAAFAYPVAPDDYLSGSSIREDVSDAFKGESLFYTDSDTGMSPGAVEDSAYTTTPTTTGSPWAEVDGRWNLNLVDTESRTLDLTLYQSGNEVFGKGYMTTGSNTQELTAAGSTEGTSLSLRLVTVSGYSMYRLKATATGNSIFGTYTAYSSDGTLWAGNCNGNRFYSTAQTTLDEPTGTVKIGSGA